MLALLALPIADTQSTRCMPALRSRLMRGVVPRDTPSIVTWQGGLDTSDRRPLPFCGLALRAEAWGRLSIEMTGTPPDSTGAAGRSGAVAIRGGGAAATAACGARSGAAAAAVLRSHPANA